jgi:hypothetical protein
LISDIDVFHFSADASIVFTADSLSFQAAAARAVFAYDVTAIFIDISSFH